MACLKTKIHCIVVRNVDHLYSFQKIGLRHNDTNYFFFLADRAKRLVDFLRRKTYASYAAINQLQDREYLDVRM